MSPVADRAPADAVAGLQEVIDAGAELVMFNPLFDDLEQMERLAAEVIPRARPAPVVAMTAPVALGAARLDKDGCRTW